MDNWVNCGYVISYCGNTNVYSVEYDWGKSVFTQYFNLYQEAIDFVGRYKKRMRIVNRMYGKK